MISSMIKLFALIHFDQVLSIICKRGRLENMQALVGRQLEADSNREALLAGRHESRITSASHDSSTGR